MLSRSLGATISSAFSTRLFVLVVALRIVGSAARYEILVGYYFGAGDATRYYLVGLDLAQRVWDFDLWFFSFREWFPDGPWWGTHFIEHISGVVLTLIGPSMRAEFLVFSLFALVGLLFIVAALARVAPAPVVRSGAMLILLWPSLWFWPSSAGKEALIILSLGIVTLGFVGKADKPNWPLLLGGIFLAFWIRPHVAAVQAMAVAAAYWLGSWDKVSPRRVAESVLAVVIAFVALTNMSSAFGLEQPDLESLQEFMTVRSQSTVTGGSSVGAAPATGAGLPMAFVNIWLRPFPWDVHNVTAAVAAGEILLLWIIIYRRRQSLRLTLKYWRQDRLLRFAFPLLVGYTLMIGMTFANLGIIARQRTPLFPFLFLLLAAVPKKEQSRDAGDGSQVASGPSRSGSVA